MVEENTTGEKIDHFFYKSLLDKLLQLVKDSYKGKLISLVLYGSVARGTAKKGSDIDIILIVENLSYTEAMNKFLLVEDRLKASEEFLFVIKAGCSPELKPIIFSRKEASESRYIFLDVLYEGIILYDKNDFFKNRLEKLRKRLKKLESKRIFREDGSWYWILAPDLRFGEVFKI